VYCLSLINAYQAVMSCSQEEILDLFKKKGAFLEGHFILRSGLHSAHFLQCARICEHLDQVERLAALLLEKFEQIEFDTVLALAMGGLVIGQEIARQSGKRFIFLEKIENTLTLRRGFTISAGERILVVEDVVTRGGRIKEALSIIAQQQGIPAGIAVLVDRSQGNTGYNLTSLLSLSIPTYESIALPEHLKHLPAVKPGSF
jgi:orotate phosphoribosyltransferase